MAALFALNFFCIGVAIINVLSVQSVKPVYMASKPISGSHYIEMTDKHESNPVHLQQESSGTDGSVVGVLKPIRAHRMSMSKSAPYLQHNGRTGSYSEQSHIRSPTSIGSNRLTELVQEDPTRKLTSHVVRRSSGELPSSRDAENNSLAGTRPTEPNPMETYTNNTNTSLLSASQTDVLALYQAYCPYTDLCHTPALRKFESEGKKNSIPCCFPCSCDESCAERNTCCLDADVQTNRSSSKIHAICSTPSFPNMLEHNGGHQGVYVIDQCEEGFSDETIIENCKCQNPTKIDDTLFVTDATSNKTYKNRFCASCNGIKQFTSWKYKEAICGFTSRLFERITNRAVTTAYLSQIIIDFNCTVQFTYEGPSTIQTCYNKNVLKDVCYGSPSTDYSRISAEKLCGSFLNPFQHEASLTTHYYSNVFCYKCNTLTDVQLECSSDRPGYLTGVLPPFTSLIDLSAVFDVPTNQSGSTVLGWSDKVCSTDEIFSKRGQCEKIVCPFLHVLGNGICRDVFEDVALMCIYQSFQLRAMNPLWNAAVDSQFFEYLSFDLHLYFDVHSTFVNANCKLLNFTVYAAQNADGSYTDSLVVDIIIQSNRGTCKSAKLLDLIKQLVSKPFYMIVSRFKSESMPFEMTTVPGLHSQGLKYIGSLNGNSLPEVPAIVLPATAFCVSTVTNTINEQGPVSINHGCLDKSWTNTKPLDGTSRTADTKNISFFLLSLISLTCLCLTLIILACFKQLYCKQRYLMIDVLINYGCFLVVSEMGHQLVGSVLFCAILGMLRHFFLIASICSLAAYVLMLYNAFTTELFTEGQQEVHFKVIFTSLSLIYIVPFLLVVTNMTLSELSAYGDDGYVFGYGGQECFVSSQTRRLVVTVAPIFLIVYGNLTVSIILSRMIKRSNPIHRQCACLRVYMTMIGVAGVTWTLQFLYELLGYEILNILFSVLKSGFGILLAVVALGSHDVVTVLLSKVKSLVGSSTEVTGT